MTIQNYFIFFLKNIDYAQEVCILLKKLSTSVFMNSNLFLLSLLKQINEKKKSNPECWFFFKYFYLQVWDKIFPE